MKAKLAEFLKLCTYISGQYDEDASFQTLEHALVELEKTYEDQNSPKNRVFYMALPPSVFTTVAACLKRNNYSEGGINRIIVEKPFGSDLKTSREMQTALKSQWKEDEVRSPQPREQGTPANRRRLADLPHRPLPRQRDGQEPSRPPIRQRHARRLVQQAPHLQRSDHVQGAVRNRGTWRLL